MVLYYVGGSALKSGRYLFQGEGEYKVDDTYGAHLLKTFPSEFKYVTDSALEPSKEDQDAKPTTVIKVVPRPSKSK